MAVSTSPDPHKTTRVASVVAATCIALACGTNYAYSAWAPQYAQRMQLSATQSNLIGNAGNIGMYATGIPAGMLIDSRGPRWGVMLGAIALACGYFPLRAAYNNGPGSVSVGALCFFGFLTGMGSCSAFSGSIKVSATNWPRHRGTATAFPLSGFGLSAFLFTLISGFAFPGNTSGYLLLLAVGTFVMVFTGMIFLRILPPDSAYAAIPTDEGPGSRREGGSSLHRTRSAHGSKTSLIGDVGMYESSVPFHERHASPIPSCSHLTHYVQTREMPTKPPHSCRHLLPSLATLKIATSTQAAITHISTQTLQAGLC